jgi:pimeloyl-ACP methyl ester carboxylesterase
MLRATLLLLLVLQGTIMKAGADIDTLKMDVVSEGYKLDVVLLKKAALTKQLPVIIFLVGSAGNSSHRTSYKDFASFFFEKTFLQNGFAVVYFDKRGVGTSEGKWYETTFEQRALDAKNVALAVGGLNFTNKEKLFVAGHSQGGWIVQLALAAYPDVFAGGISMAGPVFSVRKQLVNDYQSKYVCNKGFSEHKAYRKAVTKTNSILFFSSVFGNKGNLKQLKRIKRFEPRTYLLAIRKPLLLLFAENDALVNINWCMHELQQLFPTGKPSVLEIYKAAGETHSFKLAPKCYKGPQVTRFYSEATRQKIYDWAVAVAGL